MLADDIYLTHFSGVHRFLIYRVDPIATPNRFA